MRLVVEGRCVAQHTGDKASQRLDHHEYGNLAPEQDVIADRDLGHAQPERGVIDDALIDALVATAAENEVAFGR